MNDGLSKIFFINKDESDDTFYDQVMISQFSWQMVLEFGCKKTQVLAVTAKIFTFIQAKTLDPWNFILTTFIF